MKCQFCNCVVTQNEADEAHCVCDTGATMCPSCAREVLDGIAVAAGEYLESLDSDATFDEIKQRAHSGKLGDKALAAAEVLYAVQYDGIVGDSARRFTS